MNRWKEFFEKLPNNQKNIAYFIAGIILLVLTTKAIKSTQFVLVSTNKNVKIEVYDNFCLDTITREDSLEIFNAVQYAISKPREIEYIALHCTAGLLPKKPSTIEDWEYFFYSQKYPGYWMVGYNYIVDIDRVIALRPINKNSVLESNEIVWGVAGFNSRTVSIAYIGGLDKVKGKLVNKDTRTPLQKRLMDSLVREVKIVAPKAKIKGHYQFPNTRKTCPNFEV